MPKRVLKSPYDYVWEKKLGQGSYGKVYKVIRTNRATKATRVLAIKTCPLRSDGVEELELTVLESIRRRPATNIVRYFGYFYSNAARPFRGVEHICLAFECIKLGDLKGKLRRKKKKFKTPVLKRIAFGVLNGLLHLHEKLKYVHRDIKPANILLASDFIPKITDFGISIKLVNGWKVKNIGEGWGTLPYYAPEMWEHCISFKSDIWSFGTTLFQLAAMDKLPYAIGQTHDLVLRLKKNSDRRSRRRLEEIDDFELRSDIILVEEIDWTADTWTKHYPGLKSLLKAMFTKEANKRPGARVLMRHPWFSDLPEAQLVRSQHGIPHKDPPHMKRSQKTRTSSQKKDARSRA